jgi:hypothetical protein
MGGACSTNGEKRIMCRLLVGKPEGKRPLGRPRRGWVEDVKMDPGEIGRAGVDWIGQDQSRSKWRALVNAVMNLRFPRNAGNSPSGCTTCGLSSGTQIGRLS